MLHFVAISYTDQLASPDLIIIALNEAHHFHPFTTVRRPGNKHPQHTPLPLDLIRRKSGNQPNNPEIPGPRSAAQGPWTTNLCAWTLALGPGSR